MLRQDACIPPEPAIEVPRQPGAELGPGLAKRMEGAMAKRLMTTMLAGLVLALWLVGCLESNPQPSPEAGAEVYVPVGMDAASLADVAEKKDGGVQDIVAADVNAAGKDVEILDVDTADVVDQAEVTNGCPAVHPWLTEPQTWKCDLPDGTVCSWLAEGCEPGEKPDNVCTCVEYGGDLRFECERPFHNCLPLEGSDVPEGTMTRPLPKHREVAEVCESTMEPRADPTCTNSQDGIGSPEDECETDADCPGDGARCLDEWQGMGATLCTCYTPDCFEDADCPGIGVCSCGKTDASWYCGGPSHKSCLHKCLFSDCQTDADCGQGKFCSPSWDDCGWQIQGYHCHDPDVAECFNSWECMGADHWGCNFEQGKGWVCQEMPMCD